MPRASRVCAHPDCPEIVPGTWCTEHQPKPWAGSTRASQRPKGWAKIRARILKRDRHTCQYCGDPATEVDHITPVSRGGSHADTNLVACCTDCNAKKNIAQRRQR